MIQDVLVSVETAKAAKAAGYPQESAACYYNVEDDCVTTYAPLCVVSGSNTIDAETCEQYRANYIAVPTYAEALQWLDGRGVYVCIITQLRNGVPYWVYAIRDINGVDVYEIPYLTRVDASNAAIMNASDKLIKK